MPQQISATDGRLTWAGAASLETGDGFVKPWRLIHDIVGLYHEGLAYGASTPAGVRIAFASDTTSLTCQIEKHIEETGLDVFCDGKLVETVALANKSEFTVSNLDAKMKLVELWLPQCLPFRLKGLSIDDGAKLQKCELKKPKWITYGSSITHSCAAASPSRTWPARVAQEAGYDLTCLGYGGQCHLDTLIGLMIRDMPADFISLKLGINIQGGASMNGRTFGPSIIGFVRLIREKHPETPIAVISPIISPPRETVTNSVGESLTLMRVQVEEAVTALQDHGDEHVTYVDGLKIFGEESVNEELLPDDLHPSDEGQKVMAENFLTHVAKPIFGLEG